MFCINIIYQIILLEAQRFSILSEMGVIQEIAQAVEEMDWR